MSRSPVCGPGEMEKPNVVELPSGVLVPLSLQVPVPVPLQTPCKGSSTVSAHAEALHPKAAITSPRVSTRTFFKRHSPSADVFKLAESGAIDRP